MRWLLFLLVLITPVVSAQELYSGTVISGEGAIINGHNVSFRLVESVNRTFVNTPIGSNVVIDHLSCENNGQLEFCVTSIDYSHRDYAVSKDVYKLGVTVSGKDPGLTLTFDLDPLNYSYGELGEGSLSIFNPTVESYEVVTVVLPLKGLLVFNPSGCTLEENEIRVNSSMSPSGSHTCTFDVSGASEASYTATATMNVYHGLGEYTSTETREVVVLENPFNVTSTVTANVSSPQDFHYNVSLANSGNDPLSVETVAITFPSHHIYVVEKPSGFTQAEDTLVGDVRIDPQSAVNLSFVLRTQKPGDALVKELYEYKVENKVHALNHDVVVAIDELGPEITYDIVPKVAKPGDKVVLVAYGYNPTDLVFTRVDLTVESALKSYTFYYEELQKGVNRSLLSQVFSAPEKEGDYTFWFSTQYSTPQFTRRAINDTLVLTVRVPNNDTSESEVEPVAQEANVTEVVETIPEKTPEPEVKTAQESQETPPAAVQEEESGTPWVLILVGIVAAWIVIGGIVGLVMLRKKS